MAEEQNPQKWWQTVPGALTAVAGIITASAGLIVALHQAGLLSEKKEPAPTPTSSPAVKASPNRPDSPTPVQGSVARPQSLGWGPNFGKEAGVCLDGCNTLLPWSAFRSELERQVFPFTPNLPSGVTARTAPHAGKKEHKIEVIDQSNSVVANVWVGVNPVANWRSDGLLRVGLPGTSGTRLEILASFERFSDGTYRRR